jgi:Cu2+-exporting ATPase
MITSLLRPPKKTLLDSLSAQPSIGQATHSAGVDNGANGNGVAYPSGTAHTNGRPYTDRRDNTGDLGQAPQTEHLARFSTELVAWLRQVQQTTLAPLADEVATRYKAEQVRAAPLVRAVGQSLVTFDDHWQHFVQQHVDPLLIGRQRSQQKAELNLGLSTVEKDANRRVALAVGNIGVALAATHLFLPLAVANIAFSTWLAWPIYQRGYRMLVKQRRLSYPIVLIGSEVATYLGGYFVPASVGILVAMATQKLIQQTEDHFRRGFVNAFGPQPRTVWVVVEGVEVERPFAAISRGDLLVVEAGQTIPVDGLVTAGAATVDQHLLTGESQPAEKAQGDRVLAATLVLTGKLYVQVDKTGTETNAAQIALVLQNAVNHKLSLISRVQSFNDGMVAPLLGIGAVGWLILGPWAAAAIMGMGIGAVARVGGPLSMLSYMNIASLRGILVKDARALEVFKRVDTIVFDKTGTLTLEQPQVQAVHLFGAPTGDKVDETTLLRYAAAAEAKQTHPIAQAILSAAAERGLTLPALDEARYEMGYGIKVIIEQQTVRVGSRRFMEMEELSTPADLEALQTASHAQGHSLVLVAIDEQVVGAIELVPTIRPEAKRAVAELQAQGLALYIISGDHEAPTRHLAEQLGIDHYYAGVLPQGKAALVEGLKADGRTVCFVGDGINDAIALSKAHVSVSLRGATTIATDTAQVVLMSQDLSHLTALRELGQKFAGTLHLLFRLTVLPVALVTATTFLLHTGIYFSILVGATGFWSGVGIALLPLHRYKLQKDE